ncbi:MAG: hypothetical protein ABIE94_07155 [archaeon]
MNTSRFKWLVLALALAMAFSIAVVSIQADPGNSTSPTNVTQSNFSNITYDTESPKISLESPLDQELIQSNQVFFYYNVTDISNITECSLYIDGNKTLTNDSVEKSASQVFVYSLDDGNHTWLVECIDAWNNSGLSEQRDLWVSGSGLILPLGGGDFPLEPLGAGTAPTFDEMNLDTNVTLNIGSTKTITCTFTVSDVDGADNISGANATFYHNTVGYDSPDSNSSHYTNSSCTNISEGVNNKTFQCSFEVWYYALDEAWTCRATVWDDETSVSDTVSGSIDALFAFNTTPEYISYGELNAGENASSDTAIVLENLGNKEIDITLDGYALFDGDGNAMACTQGNVTLSYERYSLSSDIAYSAMTSLTDLAVQLDSFNLAPTTDAAKATKSVYWKMGLPKGLKGDCSGYVTIALVSS